MDEGGPDAGHDDEAPHRDPVWRRVDILLVAVVPVLVLVMAAAGTWRYHQLDQTSWRGGTLGMFATVDTPSNRLVRGVTAEGAIELVPAGLREEATRTLVTPSDENLSDLAERWAAAAPDVDLVAVEVYRTVFDPDGPSVRLSLIRAHHMDGAR